MLRLHLSCKVQGDFITENTKGESQEKKCHTIGKMHRKTGEVHFQKINFVYLQKNKKMSRSEGKKCHAKTMMSGKADKDIK